MAMLNNQMVTVWCFSHRRKYESQVGSWSLINGLRKTMIIEATKQEKWGLSELGMVCSTSQWISSSSERHRMGSRHIPNLSPSFVWNLRKQT